MPKGRGISRTTDEKARLRGCINRSLSVIDHARRLQAGEDMTGKFSAFFTREEEKRLGAGADMLDVLESVLKKPEAGRLWGCSQRERDALEDYRL